MRKPTGSFRIISDGTVSGTKVLDSDGIRVELVESVDIHLDNADSMYAIIKVIVPEVDITLTEDQVTIEAEDTGLETEEEDAEAS